MEDVKICKDFKHCKVLAAEAYLDIRIENDCFRLITCGGEFITDDNGDIVSFVSVETLREFLYGWVSAFHYYRDQIIPR